MKSAFRNSMKLHLQEFLHQESTRIGDDFLKIDLHCHDCNSNLPDEPLGRILGVPETWTTGAELLRTLNLFETSAITITNHNNARSCYDLLDAGKDVLVGAEFSCFVPDLQIDIHVLTYGFTPTEETRLNVLRRNLYHFLAFTNERNLPTVWAHPLNFHSRNGTPTLEKLDKLLLCFERFEAINGQRNSWQNILTIEWVRNTTQEKLEESARRHKLAVTEFCRNPYRKRLTGGSDDHFAVFAGTSGTLVKIPNQRVMLKKRLKSDLILEALRDGEIAPYGGWNDGEKLSLALLDYITSLAVRMEDPGLGRIILHKGTTEEKLLALAVSNGIYELRRHRFTMRFLKAFHESMRGQRPGILTRFLMKRRYPRFLAIAESFANGPHQLLKGGSARKVLNIRYLYRALSELAIIRVREQLSSLNRQNLIEDLEIDVLLNQLEIPSSLRALFAPSEKSKTKDSRYKKIQISFGNAIDALSFPTIASGLVLAAAFASAKVLNKDRSLLERLAEQFPDLNPPKRLLWLSDTFTDKNGVSGFLQQALSEIQRRNLPIDIVVCHATLEPQDHLKVLRPLDEFSLPFYPEQPFRIPDLLELQELFEDGNYDRIVCSTEGPMLGASLFLKHCHHVPASLFLHTDWLAFCRDTLKLPEFQIDRVRRFLRLMYRRFDNLFVLNSEQKRELEGSDFQLPPEMIRMTAHWANPIFTSSTHVASHDNQTPILLFVGRLSAEKGVFDLPKIFETARNGNPGVRMVIVGSGPDRERLESLLPDAEFVGWQETNQVCEWYHRASLLLLPSRFDTFGCVVLEAMTCGLPVCAYRSKGPSDIIEHGRSGFLSNDVLEMAEQVSAFLSTPSDYLMVKESARARASQYSPEQIMNLFLADLGIHVTTEIS